MSFQKSQGNQQSTSDRNDISLNPPSKRPKVSINYKDTEYPSSGLRDSIHGVLYQLNLLILFSKRAHDKGFSFRLATEMNSAVKFDDLVLEYVNDKEDGTFWRLLQAKHKQNESQKISLNCLLTETKGEFSLLKYFIAFREIKRNPNFNSKTNKVKDYILCTNIDLDETMLDSFEQIDCKDDILDTDVSGKLARRLRFKKDFPEKEKLVLVLKKASDLHRLAAGLADCIKGIKGIKGNAKIDLHNPLFKMYHIALIKQEVIDITDPKGPKLHANFVKGASGNEKFRKIFEEAYQRLTKKEEKPIDVWSEVKNKRLNLSATFGKERSGKDEINETLPDDDVTLNEVDEFLEKLVLAVNQPNEQQLEKIIEEELREEFNNSDSKNIFLRLYKYKLDWMKEKTGRFITDEDIKAFLDTVKQQILGAVRFNVKVPVDSFTGREEELQILHTKLQGEIQEELGKEKIEHFQRGIVAITGLGGVGKTELSRMYAQKYQFFYDGNIVCINAESYDTMVRSFTDLARDNRLGIPLTYKDGKEKPIETTVSEVYKFFSKKKSVFIFDNADKDKDEVLKQFLPLRDISPVENKPFILITSRQNENVWGQWLIKAITLKVFNEQEAVNFVKKVLCVDNEQMNDIKALAVETLQMFPLALQQATAHIREENTRAAEWNDKYTIKDYLKDYEDKLKTLLGSEHFRNLENDYAKTTLTTWIVTTSKIKCNLEFGELALEILNTISYFASSNIPIELSFSKLATENKAKLRNAVSLLYRYSMIKLEGGYVDIHKLVQEVTRLELREADLDKSVIQKTLGLFVEIFRNGSDTPEYFKINRELLPHYEACLPHIRDMLNRRAEDNKDIKANLVVLLSIISQASTCNSNPKRTIEVNEEILRIWTSMREGINLMKSNIIQVGALETIGNSYGRLGNHKKQMEYYERVLEIKQSSTFNVHNDQSIEVAKTLTLLGKCCIHIKNFDQAKCHLEKALALFGEDNNEARVLYHNLGTLYVDTGKLHVGTNFLEKALEMFKRQDGEDHFDVASVLTTLGSAYLKLSKHDEAKTCFEQAIKITENYYGSDSFELVPALVNIGACYNDLNQSEVAKTLLERALKITENHYGENHLRVPNTLIFLAHTYQKLHNLPKKLELLQRAIKIYENSNIHNYDYSKELKHTQKEEDKTIKSIQLLAVLACLLNRSLTQGEGEIDTWRSLYSIASIMAKLK